MTYSDVIKQLPPGLDGFVVGTCVRLEFDDGTEPHDVIKQSKLFIPSDRCSFAPLEQVMTEQPRFFDIMLQRGLSDALKIPSGFLAYDPNFIEIIQP